MNDLRTRYFTCITHILAQIVVGLNFNVVTPNVPRLEEDLTSIISGEHILCLDRTFIDHIPEAKQPVHYRESMSRARIKAKYWSVKQVLGITGPTNNTVLYVESRSHTIPGAYLEQMASANGETAKCMSVSVPLLRVQ